MNPIQPMPAEDLEYPDSDGEPMSDNTLQWDWMVKIVSELRVMYAGKNVFVAGDLLWYPVEGEPKTRIAPDGMVVFDRPPGYRGSYQQWKECGIAPHVVFEVLSPKNTYDEMVAKHAFYEKFGVEEFYIIDPYESNVDGYCRKGDKLASVQMAQGFTSPRLGIRFKHTRDGLLILTPEGREFQSREEHVEVLQEEIRRAAEALEHEMTLLAAVREQTEHERQRAELERQRAETERLRAEAERAAKDKAFAKLRELGVNPDDVLGGGI
jgi:Uma2 family endonuclease